MQCVARRVVERAMLALINSWLKALAAEVMEWTARTPDYGGVRRHDAHLHS